MHLNDIIIRKQKYLYLNDVKQAIAILEKLFFFQIKILMNINLNTL